MTFIQKFLLLFADYREAITKTQRAEDEAQILRGRVEDLEKQLRETLVEMVRRAEEMTDRMMVLRYGQKSVLTPEQIASKLGESDIRPARTPQATDRKQAAYDQALKNLDSFIQHKQ